ncbi:S8 family peptidase [Qipengyuania sp.]|uniref:S8 family peptidase n=1 Tax=Qipengyuania sp. TaxID=2004515 RepID=UPI003BA88B83
MGEETDKEKPSPRREGGAVRHRLPSLASLLARAVAGQRLPSVISGQVGRFPESVLDDAAITLTEADILGTARPRLATQVSNSRALGARALRELAVSENADLDPRLQLALANRRSGMRGFATASTEADEVSVIAHVRTLKAWREHPDVMAGAQLGKAKGRGFLVTGRIPIDRVEALAAETDILDLRAAQPVHPTLGASVEQTGADPASFPEGFDPQGGDGVVIGVVDYGCDFAHRNFMRADGSSRLESIWDQLGIASIDSPMGYGRRYSAAQIDAALSASDPYDALGYGPEPDSPLRTGTHGTHVMDIAGGNGTGSGQAGIAPEATLIFVDIAASDISRMGPGVVNQHFGDSVQLLEAVRYIFDEAGDRPCVVNLSLGTNGGPHDGSSLVEQGIDALVEGDSNRAIVIAAGNSHGDGTHTSGRVTASGSLDIGWDHPGEWGGEFELWYDGDRRLEVELIAPDGTRFGPVRPGSSLPLGDHEVIIFIASIVGNRTNGDNAIGIWVAENVMEGEWTVRLTNMTSQGTDFHAWIERDDYAQSYFTQPVESHTLGSISTSRKAIVVGAFDGHKASLPVYTYSSTGPTRDGREKPEVSAPGQNVFAARSRTTGGVTRKSGTSMAAPAVSGLIALLYADAARRGQDLSIDELRDELIRRARRDPPKGGKSTWHPRRGFGRAHI